MATTGQAGMDRYGRAAIAFHCTIAALIAANLLIGLNHDTVFDG